jgi:hypothetical protein
MKKKIIYSVALAAIVMVLMTCKKLETCETCKLNKYDDSGKLIEEGTGVKYCGTDLVKIKATPDVTIPGIGSTKYVCSK